MSAVELYTFDRQGDASLFGRVKNAWGYALHVWDTLAGKYSVGYSMFDSRTHDALWDLAYRSDVIRDDRILMSATFDRTWVKREHLAELAAIIDRFCERHSTDTLVNVAELMEAASKLDIIGVGIHGNSVSTHYWQPIHTDEDGSQRPFNFFQDLIEESPSAPAYKIAHVELMSVLNKTKL